MAVTNGPRLGLTRWSASSDSPTRLQFDGDHGRLEDLAAIDVQVATLADRPAPGIRGRFCSVLDSGAHYRDTGSTWRRLTEVTASMPPAVGPTLAAAVGTSEVAARGDHRHAMPAYGGVPAISLAASGLAGTADSIARSDHRHQVRVGLPVGSAPGDAVSSGASADLARADHQHAREGRPSTAQPGTLTAGTATSHTGVVRLTPGTESGAAFHLVFGQVLLEGLTADSHWDVALVDQSATGNNLMSRFVASSGIQTVPVGPILRLVPQGTSVTYRLDAFRIAGLGSATVQADARYTWIRTFVVPYTI